MQAKIQYDTMEGELSIGNIERDNPVRFWCGADKTSTTLGVN
jgi:hypothetical protein